MRQSRFPINFAGLTTGMVTTALLALSSTFNPFHFQDNVMLAVRVVGWGSAVMLFLFLLRRVLHGDVQMKISSVLLATALLSAPFFLSQPIFSGDVYAYAAGVRVSHIGNPYTLPPVAIGNQPILHGVATDWWNRPSAYGPLWQVLSRVISFVSLSDSAVVTLFRALMLGALLSVVWFVARAADAGRALLIGASPVVLIDAVGDAHNDMLIGLAMLVAVLMIQRPVRAAFAFAASVALKFLPAIVAPALIAATPPEKRWKLALWIGISTIALLMGTFVPFWVGTSTFTGLQLQGQLFGHPLFAPQFLVYMVGYLFETPIHPEVLARAVGAALFVAIGFGVCVWAWRKKISPVAALAITIGAYLMFGTPYVQTWYLLWVLPLLCLLPVRHAVRWTSIATIIWAGMLLLLPSHFLAS